jgi:hypothetical protein
MTNGTKNLPSHVLWGNVWRREEVVVYEGGSQVALWLVYICDAINVLHEPW